MVLSKSKIAIFAGIAGILGGVAALLTYIDNKKNRKLDAEVKELEKELKVLQIAKTRDEILAK